jgi:hypothetical protein
MLVRQLDTDLFADTGLHLADFGVLAQLVEAGRASANLPASNRKPCGAAPDGDYEVRPYFNAYSLRRASLWRQLGSWPPRPSLATVGIIWCAGLNLRLLKVSLRVGGAA